MLLRQSFDLLTATANNVRCILEAGETTSLPGMKLNAFISTASLLSVIQEAKAMDEKRAKGHTRSRLHGIPIVLNGLIVTGSFGMEITSGSFALESLKAAQDATIAALLRRAGHVEWGNSKGIAVTSGSSATQSPYVQEGVTQRIYSSRSSPGSAVATATSFAPLCIDTKADGSFMQPAIRAALYGIKGTVVISDMANKQSGRAEFDSADPMTKSVEDCADNGIRVTSLNYDIWQSSEALCEKTAAFDDEHMKTGNGYSYARIKCFEALVTFGAPLMTVPNITATYEAVGQSQLATHQLAPTIKQYLPLFNEPPMGTLADVVEFNRTHTKYSLRPKASVHLYLLPSIAAMAGYPIASIPLGFFIYYGRLFGMEFMARNGQEEKTFKVMLAREATFPEARRPPPLMLGWSSSK
ncbi:amidase signature domain-containing protein [Dactylonectria estremocensis]|uniref:Amidase signature domain-containing protein n=1 Tax=Dactylonectria estremocensis TaxID=1079267 RepID=A0A9P9EGD4_9HYPO|nr:amidase signature domain-containing protein [Dactylonectria estremocensis]